MGEYEYVKFKKEDGIGIVTLDSPPVNALNIKMVKELGQLFDEIERDEEVKAVVVTGAGPNAFSAGADVKDLAGLSPDQAIDIVKLGHEVFTKIEKFSKPVIAALKGFVLGGGNELAMACDIRVASDRARIGQPEVTLGLIPAWGGTQRLARLVGKGKAKELIFTGQMISAQEAYRIGLIQKVVPDGEELRAAMDIARVIITRCSPLAVREAKKAINEGLEKPTIEEALNVELGCMERLAQSEDLREGLTAFIEKRRPQFKGK